MKMANTYKIKIFNKDLSIVTDQTQEYTQWLADKLNEKLSEVTVGVANLTLTDASILVALDCLDKAVKSEESAQNIRAQIKEYADAAAKSKQAADEKDAKIEKLERRINQLEQGNRTAPSYNHQDKKPQASNVFVTKKQEVEHNSDRGTTGGQTSFFK